MREICVDGFLMKCNPKHVERHSDSSDFESPCKIPLVASKGGNHRLLSGKICNTKQDTHLFNNKTCEMCAIYNAMNSNKIKTSDIQSQPPVLATTSNTKRDVMNLKAKLKNNTAENNNRGDQSLTYFIEKVHTRSLAQNGPCVSSIFRRNYIKHMSSIEEKQTHNINNQCTNCDRRRKKKFSKRRRDFSVQPVYNVEGNAEFPFLTNNTTLPKVNNASTKCTDVSNDVSSSSDNDADNINTYKNRKFLKKMKEKFEKEIKDEYIKYNSVKNQKQQYPSKFHLSPYQIYTSSSCQAKCTSSSEEENPSSSSAFWDFLARKMMNKIQKPGISKSCECVKPLEPCKPENCQFLEGAPEKPFVKDSYYNNELIQETYSPCQIDDTDKCDKEKCISESNSASKKKSKESKVICKCYPDPKQKGKKGEMKPCQEEHEGITKAISDKYNGEILCIHNPPCILINGCLNLPPPKQNNIQGNLWPVTQIKKSSFIQMCQKFKRNKLKSTEQSSQYHPPSQELEECLPEFKTEKLIQSICDHDPPCEIVHGCYKVQYDPRLQNSCIHVPMCQKLPECLFFEKNIDTKKKSCGHSPKCTNFPMCSRKYITLTAKENIGTQVKPRTKLVCRHIPPCFMIPKCLAQAINGDYIPYGAIPGCIHQPCCEMIPACCRKSGKEMVSVPSQYPNNCRIV